MSSIKPVKQTVTSTENTLLLGAGLSSVLIKNQGANDVLIDFDKVIDSDSYLLEAGEVLEIGASVIYISFKTASSTSTLYLIKV